MKKRLRKLRARLAKVGKKIAPARESVGELRRRRRALDDAIQQKRENSEENADRIEELRARRREVSRKLDRKEKRLGALREIGGDLKKAISKLKKRVANRDEFASPHFRYSEFDQNDGRGPVPEQAYAALRHLASTYLEPLRKEFGSVHVLSGNREPDYNARIGGVSNSQHIYRNEPESVAADVRAATGSPAEWAAFLDRLGPGGLGTYRSSNFVHVDNRQRSGWNPARWNG